VRRLSTIKQEEKWWQQPIGTIANGIFISVVAGLIVWTIQRHYDRPAIVVPKPNVERTGNGITSGGRSPVVTGNNNTINYGRAPDSSKKEGSLFSGNKGQTSGDDAVPRAEPEPKVVLSKQVGDLFLEIKECARTGDIADKSGT